MASSGGEAEARASGGGIIELTDGWYSVHAVLDEPLTQHMALGKIYPGLKLRIVGARVCTMSNSSLTFP